VARLLIDRGFVKVRPLAGGLDGWVDGGFPVEGEPLYAIRPAAP
jgi:rhodanese-related sulfurtransferase